MRIWTEWWSWVAPLRPACSRLRSFLWLLTALAGISIRCDLLGVTSIVRALGLGAQCYHRLLDFFHPRAVDPDALCRCWVRVVFARIPGIHRVNGRPVLLGDGLKIPKRGRKMPAVKLLHQVSDCNTKPEYIMGHSFQVVSILVSAAATFFAVPLSARIHEGLVFSNRANGLPQEIPLLGRGSRDCRAGLPRRRRLLRLLYDGLGADPSRKPFDLQASQTCVAFEPIPPTVGERKRGRPRLYGPKIHLFTLFEKPDDRWITTASPVYGEKDVLIRYLCLDLLWRLIRRLARFVLVNIRTGNASCSCARSGSELDRDHPALRPALQNRVLLQAGRRTLVAYGYHFWMMAMDEIGSRSGDQYLHRKTNRTAMPSGANSPPTIASSRPL